MLEWIRDGYKLPLLYAPAPYEHSNHSSALDHHNFVTENIKELLANRCVREVKEKPFVCSPLSVVTNHEGKCRLVLNLRVLNQYLRKDHFKYEDLRTAMLMLNRGDYLFKFDLKSGYHHLDVFEPHQCYLGFAWDLHGEQSYFVFTVLPFGLSSACYAFTKLLRPLVGYWRGQGMRVVLYLDDGIVAAEGLDKANQASGRVRQDLASAGFIANEQKSQWNPVQQLVWLGFELNMQEEQLLILKTKLARLCELLESLNHRQFIPTKVLASLIGKIVSMSLALGPVTRLMTRSLYATLNSRGSWCQQLALSQDAKAEIQFWRNNISQFNGLDLWPKPSAVRVVYSDASNTGYGGYTVEHGGADSKWSMV